MTIWQWFLAIAAGAGAVYVAAWIASSAYFGRKMQYNRDVLDQLETKKKDDRHG